MMIGQERLPFPFAVAISTLWITAAFGGNGAPDYDFDWATIGDPGNAAYPGLIEDRLSNRGSVGYTYRMSKLEVTSDQWLEFITTIGPVVGDLDFGMPGHFGYFDFFPGVYIPWTPQPSDVPVQGISWRESAMYVNWLHNGKQATVEAISDGAYDISTFHTNEDGTFTDQPTRNPDAKFWIPSLDEWIKAAHYDPDKNGEGDGGWWTYSTTSDTAPVPGPPGEGETSADDFDWVLEGVELSAQLVPLGSYPDVTSPWGLLDTSGGATEWTEEIRDGIHAGSRVTEGAPGGFTTDVVGPLDRIDDFSGGNPDSNFWQGLRVASAIPSPPSALIIVLVIALHTRTRSKRDEK